MLGRRRRIFLPLLLLIVVSVGVAVGIDALDFGSSPDTLHSDTIRASQGNTIPGQVNALAVVVESLVYARKESNELRSQLARATEQLKSSQDRIGQVEAQLKQTPRPADLDKARKQGDEQRSQLAQATEQLKSSQDRIGQLEAQLKQAPGPADLDKARTQLKSSQDQISQLEAQLKQAQRPADLDKARKQADEQRSHLAQATEQLKSSQDPIGQLEVQLSSTVSDQTNTSNQTNTSKRVAYSSDTEPLLDPKAEPDNPVSSLPLPATASQSPDTEAASRPRPEPAFGTTGRSKNPSHIVSAAHPAAAAISPAAVATQVLPKTSVEISPLLERGNRLFAAGDVASARLFYQRAADAGDGQAALRLGETYDPVFLQRTQLRVPGNRALAVFWYGRARELGTSEAEILLKDTQNR